MALTPPHIDARATTIPQAALAASPGLGRQIAAGQHVSLPIPQLEGNWVVTSALILRVPGATGLPIRGLGSCIPSMPAQGRTTTVRAVPRSVRPTTEAMTDVGGAPRQVQVTRVS